MSLFLYKLSLVFIRVLKCFELCWMTLFHERVKRMCIKSYKNGGVAINGDKPWDIQVSNEGFYTRVVNRGSLGIGESYMDGHWECKDIVELTCRTMKNGIYKTYLNPWNRFLNYLECYHFNLQTKERAWEVGETHYDTGNDLFESFLDSSMNYSCGYWRKADNLEDAQIAKMDLIAKKLDLSTGMKVLDIGCGWGGLCHYLATHYGVSVVGITVSKEGAAEARKRNVNLPVNIKLMDYRDVDESFDRIVSVGMFEHVGHNNYAEYFSVAHRCLRDGGLFLLHTIGVNDPEVPCSEPWFHTYIFPNGILPQANHITQASSGLFIIEDWQNFGYDYYRTLLAWLEKFKRNWPNKLKGKYGDRFYRMWTYYLQFSAGAFKSRKFQLWQVVLSKNGVQGGSYYAAR